MHAYQRGRGPRDQRGRSRALTGDGRGGRRSGPRRCDQAQGPARARRDDHTHDRGPSARYRLGARRPLRTDRRRLPGDGQPQDRLLLGGRSARIGAIVGGGTAEQIDACARSGWLRDSRSRSKTTCSTWSGRARRPRRTSAPTSPRASARSSPSTRCSTRATRAAARDHSARETDPALLAEAVEIMREAGSVDFAKDYARDLVVSAKGDLSRSSPRPKPRTSCFRWPTSSSSAARRWRGTS